MSDFVFLISGQQLATLGLAIIGIVAFMIAVWIGVEWVMEMIENYADDAENWHITEDRHHDIH